MDTLSALDRVIRRDRLLTALGLAALTIVAWAYLVHSAAMMDAMSHEAQMHVAMGMGDMRAWNALDWLGLFVMWAVMMVAMMLPSAAPVFVLVLGVYRRRAAPQARAAAYAFVAGYVLVWTMFSVAASLVQLLLHRAAVMSPDMRIGSAAVSGIILMIAGIYQWVPFKNACLTTCQSPLGFLSQYWREGVSGGFLMGARHGLFCVGCCWMLMMLLFVVGVMNLIWVAALAALVLVEKLFRGGAVVGRIVGAAAVAWGIYLVVLG